MHCLMEKREQSSLMQTPFYATMGGQEADKGVIRTADGEFVVEDTYSRLQAAKVGHVGHVTKGMIKSW